MDFKEIKELIRVFDKSELNKLKIKDKDFEISIQTGFEGGTVVSTTAPVAAPAPVQTPAPAPAATPAAETETETPACAILGETIDSPMVGTYYASPSPESAPFVKAGDTVKKGQTLCILEAMKIMNEVEAEFDCKILNVLVQDGEPVEYDMPIFVVEKL